MAGHNQSSCLLCCGKLIDNSFTAQNAKSLSRILRLGFSAGVGLESDSDLLCSSFTSSDSQFSLWFQSATYCPDCVRTVQDLENILRNLDDLDKKLREGRTKVEEKLRTSHSRSGINVENEMNEESNYNETLRDRIVAGMDRNKEKLAWISSKLEQWPEISTKEEHDGRPLKKRKQCKISPDNFEEQQKIDNPPSPTDSFGCDEDEIREDKFILPETPPRVLLEDSEEVELQTKSKKSRTGLRPLRSLRIRSKRKPEPTPTRTVQGSSRISRGVLSGERENCPHYPECRQTFAKNEAIRLMAHVKRVHEGVKRCYICQTCGKGFIRGDQLERHTPVHDASESNANATQTKLEASESLSFDVVKSREKDLPIVLLQKLTSNEVESVKTRCKSRIAELKHKYAVHTQDKKFETAAKKKRLKKFAKPTAKSAHKQRSLVDGDREPRISCPNATCGRTYRASQNCHLQAHIKRDHEDIQNCYECEICQKSFPNYRQFRTHEFKHSGVPPRKPHTCKHCQQICTSYDKLRLHVTTEHFPHLIKYRCEYCDLVFVRKHYLELHLLRHTKKKPYLCEICCQSFKTKTYLKYHQSKYHAEISTYDPIKCKECGRVFAAPANLRGHVMKVHRGEFKHKCQLCDYGAMTPSGLGIHMTNKHSDERKFQCSHCPSSFKHKNALTVHVRTHTGERPYKCSTCDKRFTSTGHLRRHELIHSGAQCHTCEVCGKTFPVRNYLYIHMRSHNKSVKRPKQIRNKKTTKTPTSQGQQLIACAKSNPIIGDKTNTVGASACAVAPVVDGNATTTTSLATGAASRANVIWDQDRLVEHNT